MNNCMQQLIEFSLIYLPLFEPNTNEAAHTQMHNVLCVCELSWTHMLLTLPILSAVPHCKCRLICCFKFNNFTSYKTKLMSHATCTSSATNQPSKPIDKHCLHIPSLCRAPLPNQPVNHQGHIISCSHHSTHPVCMCWFLCHPCWPCQPCQCCHPSGPCRPSGPGHPSGPCHLQVRKESWLELMQYCLAHSITHDMGQFRAGQATHLPMFSVSDWLKQIETTTFQHFHISAQLWESISTFPCVHCQLLRVASKRHNLFVQTNTNTQKQTNKQKHKHTNKC